MSIDDLIKELTLLTKSGELEWTSFDENRLHRTYYNDVHLTLARVPFAIVLERWAFFGAGHKLGGSFRGLVQLAGAIGVYAKIDGKVSSRIEETHKQETLSKLLTTNANDV